MFSFRLNVVPVGLLILASALIQAQTSQPPTHSVPELAFYSVLFRHLAVVQDANQINTSHLLGIREPLSNPVHNFIIDKSISSSNEAITLIAEARQFNAEVEPVDQQAAEIIRTLRAKHPNGRLAPGELPPPVPSILFDLQHKRDDIVSNHVAMLKQHLGEQRFKAIDAQLRVALHPSSKSPLPR